MSSRLTRITPLLLAGVLPAALLCIGIVHVILNHFFSHAPYLLDAGWYSDIVYRAGLAPRNPQIACDYAEWYFGVHFSPFISVFSIASYVVPLDRIEWYAVFQAICFLPFGVATYMLASRLEPQISPRRLPVTVAAAIAFAFNGQILRMVTYPHYEGAIAGFGCLVLVALVTARMRLAWILFAIAISVREDAGFHTALAVAPLLYLRWRGVDMSPSRRTLITMIAIAIGSSVVGSLCQKLVFHGPSVMTIVYLGDPIYGHLSWSVLGQRAQNFLATCQVMYYPFIATCIVAAVKRDVRYLLGWVAGLPWFVLNFLAAQEQKATFEAYSGFPYIVSIFWVYLYGATLAPVTRRFRPVIVEAIFIAICLLATVGLYRPDPRFVTRTVKEMAFARRMNRAAVHEFAAVLDDRRADFGRLYVDYAVAAVALESMTPQNAWIAGVKGADAIAFHTETVERDRLLPDVLANGLDVCTHVIDTGFVVCARDRFGPQTFAGLRTETFPSLFAFAKLTAPGVAVTDRGISLDAGGELGGRLGLLAGGTYELTIMLDSNAGGTAEISIISGKDIRASATLPAGSRQLTIRFAAHGDDAISFRLRSASSLVVTHAEVRSETTELVR